MTALPKVLSLKQYKSILLESTNDEDDFRTYKYNHIINSSNPTNLETPSVSASMRRFQNMVNHCSLVDMSYHGPLYTWSNKRGNDLIWILRLQRQEGGFLLIVLRRVFLNKSQSSIGSTLEMETIRLSIKLWIQGKLLITSKRSYVVMVHSLGTNQK